MSLLFWILVRTPDQLAHCQLPDDCVGAILELFKRKNFTMNSVNASLDTIQVNGVTYVPVGSTSNTLPSGNRMVVVVDRGWIFAGDVETDEVTNDLVIHNAIHVFRWESIGFTGVLANPKDSKVTLKTSPYPVRVPAGSVIFTVPVDANWGK